MFETVKQGEKQGQLVRLTIGSTAIMRKPMEHHKLGLSYTATGYGSKIPTEYMVQTIDNKWRRVYCCIFSNNGTLYVQHGKEKTIVDLAI
jgi:hypothetical protein